MESQLVQHLSGVDGDIEKMKPVDSLVLTSFIDKFNDKYSDKLTTEQNKLLNLYIMSFSDNSLSLKSFLNEEISRLKKVVEESIEIEEFTADEEMKEKASRIIEKLNSFKASQPSESVISTVLKTQALAEELT